jgi:intraflagellar transport protein 88
VRICTDLGLKDVQEYAQKLMKAEKTKELKEQVCWLSMYVLF